MAAYYFEDEIEEWHGWAKAEMENEMIKQGGYFPKEQLFPKGKQFETEAQKKQRKFVDAHHRSLKGQHIRIGSRFI